MKLLAQIHPRIRDLALPVEVKLLVREVVEKTSFSIAR